jgi:large subunit ribosomal protein L15
MRLHDLKAPRGANRNRKRVGRGESSGHGKTASKGAAGQKKRSGMGKPGLGFEGGQVPMYRRMPKRGFVNIFRRQYAEVNVDSLALHFPAGATVDLSALRERGLAARADVGVRVLGRGELTHSLTVVASHFSKSASAKIEAAGGAAQVVGAPQPVAG